MYNVCKIHTTGFVQHVCTGIIAAVDASSEMHFGISHHGPVAYTTATN